MTVIRFNPHKAFACAGQNFERVFNSVFANSGQSNEQGDLVPYVNISENDEMLMIAAELPGMEKGEIKVVFEDGILTISGDKKSHGDDNANLLRSELNSGKFSRTFTIPDYVDAEKIVADYKNGILKISLTKVEQAKPKEITVNIN